MFHDAFEAGREPPLGLPFDTVFGELIATGAWRSLGVMRQPVLVAADSDDALDPRRYAALLVRLQLGHIDDDISLQECVGDVVFVPRVLVMLVGLRDVVFG